VVASKLMQLTRLQALTAPDFLLDISWPLRCYLPLLWSVDETKVASATFDVDSTWEVKRHFLVRFSELRKNMTGFLSQDFGFGFTQSLRSHALISDVILSSHTLMKDVILT